MNCLSNLIYNKMKQVLFLLYNNTLVLKIIVNQIFYKSNLLWHDTVWYFNNVENLKKITLISDVYTSIHKIKKQALKKINKYPVTKKSNVFNLHIAPILTGIPTTLSFQRQINPFLCNKVSILLSIPAVLFSLIPNNILYN